MKKPQALDCATEIVNGFPVRMFPIGKQEQWLLRMVAGNTYDKRALKRCTVFQELGDQLLQRLESIASSSGEIAKDSKMAAMSFDDEEGEQESPVSKNRKRSREGVNIEKYQRGRYFKDSPPTHVRVLEEASSKEERDVCLMVRQSRLWIDEDNLAWIALRVKADLNSGGIAPIEEDVVKDSNIWWDFQDDCWIAQRGSDGQHEQTRGYVQARMRVRGDPCFGLAKNAAKRIIFDELSEWVRCAK